MQINNATCQITHLSSLKIFPKPKVFVSLCFMKTGFVGITIQKAFTKYNYCPDVFVVWELVISDKVKD